jgi:hypothetical protein
MSKEPASPTKLFGEGASGGQSVQVLTEVAALQQISEWKEHPRSIQARQELPRKEHFEEGALRGRSTSRKEHFEEGALRGRSTSRKEHFEEEMLEEGMLEEEMLEEGMLEERGA